MTQEARSHRLTRATAIVLGLAAASAGHAGPIISNGGFESGLAGWTTDDALGGDGTFFVQSGTSSPVNADPVPAPPAGNAAMTDGAGPGSHVLYQDFLVPSQVTFASITFDLFIGNRGSDFFVPSPASLEFGIAAINQQARVDILLGNADPFSIAGGDVLLNLYQTQPGDPVVDGYKTISADLTSLLAARTGQTLRLRFAETDNFDHFQLGVDNVVLNVPEPATAMLFGGSLAGILFAGRRRKRAAAPA